MRKCLFGVLLLLIGCHGEIRVMTDAQYKKEHMGQIHWIGDDHRNKLVGKEQLPPDQFYPGMAEN